MTPHFHERIFISLLHFHERILVSLLHFHERIDYHYALVASARNLRIRSLNVECDMPQSCAASRPEISPHLTISTASANSGGILRRTPCVPCNTFTAHPAAPLGSRAAKRRPVSFALCRWRSLRALPMAKWDVRDACDAWDNGFLKLALRASRRI